MRFGEELDYGPCEPYALFKATTEIAIQTTTTAIPSKVSIERLLYLRDAGTSDNAGVYATRDTSWRARSSPHV